MHYRKTVAHAAVAATMFAASPAWAAPLKLLLLDDMSCAAWTQSASEPEERQNYVDWVRGFLSGHNYGRQKEQVSVVSNGTIAQFVDRYCRIHPKGSVADAAMQMSDRFSGRNAPITK